MAVWLSVFFAGLAAPALIRPSSNASVLEYPEKALLNVVGLETRVEETEERLGALYQQFEAFRDMYRVEEEKRQIRLNQVDAIVDTLNHNIKRINKLEDQQKIYSN